VAPSTTVASTTPVQAVEQFGALPLMVVSPVDLGRLLRELESYDALLEQQRLSKAVASVHQPSALLRVTAELNHIVLEDRAQRNNLRQFLESLKTKAPTLHISFSSDPSPLFVETLMTWLRREIHPAVLLTIGMQPTIGAGCMVRTTNKFFDLSLRKHFQETSGLLKKALEEQA
jgi:F0F1-type ATP synthase delta subunit